MGSAVCHRYLSFFNLFTLTLPLRVSLRDFRMCVWKHCAVSLSQHTVCGCVYVCCSVLFVRLCVAVLACFQPSPIPTICTHSIRGRRTDWFPHRETTQAGVLAVVSSRARTASTPIRLACMHKHTRTHKDDAASTLSPVHL